MTGQSGCYLMWIRDLSPLTENGVQSGVSSRSETASDHGLTKRNFPEGDAIKGFLDIRINDMG